MGYHRWKVLGFQIAGFGAEIAGLDAVGLSKFAHWLIHDCPFLNLLLWKWKLTRFIFNCWFRVVFVVLVVIHVVVLPLELLIFIWRKLR
jgi:hypothetical protein